MAQVALTNIEFLCLKMQTHPGMPGRWYRAQLSKYKNPRAFAQSKYLQAGNVYGFYFRRASYHRDRDWETRCW